MKTKPDCLNLLAAMRRLRARTFAGGRALWSKFPWLAFLIQGGQVTAQLWGRGIELGAIMGFVADAMWASIRSGGGNSIILRGRPGGDPVTQAAQYMTQPKYQYTAGDLFTYQEHWVLLAADVIASSIIMQAFPFEVLSGRVDTVLSSPLIYQEPWHPDTIAALELEGWKPGGPYRPPFAGMDERSTYGQVVAEAANRVPQFFEESARDFPKSTTATVFINVFADLALDLIAWGNGGSNRGSPVFDPWEITIARMFEYGVLPPSYVNYELMGAFAERSGELAVAAGREFAGPIEMRSAANEVWGSYLTS